MKMLALDAFEWGDMKMDPKLPVIGGVPAHEADILGNPITTDEMKSKGKSLQGTRPLIVYTWINKLIMQRLDTGGLRAKAPITARHMTTLQEAMAAFGHAVKLSNTQFPFPWAQVVMAFQVMMAITLPFAMVSFMDQEGWMGIMMTWMVVTTYTAINEVAAEMEDPYGLDPNDLPMERFVYDFNQGLCSACWQLRPEYFAKCTENTKNFSFKIKNMKQAIALVMQINKLNREEDEAQPTGFAGVAAKAKAAALAARGSGTKSPATVVPVNDGGEHPADAVP